MSEPEMSGQDHHDHDDFDECVRVLTNVYAFLHNEMSEAEADAIRRHLHACERCLENFDIEQTIAVVLRRCCSGVQAPTRLRVSISQTIIRSSRQIR